MKKVVFICNYKPGVGGISGQVESLQKHLRKDGYIADIFTTKGSIWKRLGLKKSFYRAFRDYDLIHVHCCSGWGFMPAVLGVHWAKRLNKRIVVTYHGGGAERFFKNHSRLVKYYLDQTDENVVLSEFLGKVFTKYSIPYKVIPNIIELNEAVYRERSELSPSFICVRSHEIIYNIPCILRAFLRFQSVVPGASLTLVGGGSQHGYLKDMALKMGLNNVSFTGRVDNRSIYEYLDKADIMLSSPNVDNMPVSILEAMNAGLLVISSKVGGVPFIIDNGKTGLLFEPNNDSMLAKQMLWVIDHQTESRRMITNAKNAVSRYTWDEIKNDILRVYEWN